MPCGSKLSWRHFVQTYAITVIRNHLIDCCRKQTNWRKYISEQSLDDPDAGLPTPFCTDHAHFSGVDTGAVLTSCKKHYRGVAKLGIDALVLKTKGFDCKDIAVLYHTSSNNVGAWISRAAKKLRSDPDFLDAFDIAC